MPKRYVLLLLALTGCGGGGSDFTVAPQSAESFCAMFPPTNLGNYFYCGTAQANLQTVNFPNGARGFCMPPGESLGLVGYSAITYNGGATPVTSQSTASEQSRLLGNQSPGYIRCTRQ